MKKKAMIMAVASLGSMALIGTGFAGWVISANATTNASGVIAAYDVADHRLSVEDGKICAYMVLSDGSLTLWNSTNVPPTLSKEDKEELENEQN